MMDAVGKSAVVPAPRVGRQWRIEASDSVEVFETPKAWLGRWVEIHAFENSIEIQFAPDPSVTIDSGETSSTTGSGSSGSPYVLSDENDIASTISDDRPTAVYVEPTDLYFALISGTADTVVEARVASR